MNHFPHNLGEEGAHEGDFVPQFDCACRLLGGVVKNGERLKGLSLVRARHLEELLCQDRLPLPRKKYLARNDNSAKL